MKAYKGTFIKKTGERRVMRFIKLEDLANDEKGKSILSTNIQGKQKHNLAAGYELVWDIDESELRIFNHNTAVDKLEEFEYTLP
jgi:hypothetical protein